MVYKFPLLSNTVNNVPPGFPFVVHMASSIEIEVDPSAVVIDEDLDTSAFHSFKMGNRERASTKHPFKYSCPFCGKRYTSRSGLLSHKNSLHFQRRPYRCEYCNDHFHSSAQRVGHIKKRHPEMWVKEKQSIEKPSPEEEMDEPESVKNGTSEHVFSIGKSITISLVKPKSKRIGPKKGTSTLLNVPCTINKKKRVSTSKFVKHFPHPYKQRAIGKNEILDKYVCVECNETFFNTDVLLQHMKTHLNEYAEDVAQPMNESNNGKNTKEFACESCRRNFPTKIWYSIHNKYHHPDLYRETESNDQYTCAWCDKVFPRSQDRILHECLHCKSAKLTCRRCEFKCSSIQELMTHLDKEHGANRLKCPLCIFIAAGKEEYLSHLDKSHGDKNALLKCSMCDITMTTNCEGAFRKFHNHVEGHIQGALNDVLIVPVYDQR